MSCDECAEFVYDLKTGEQQTRGGQPARRPAGAPTPCFDCPKCAGQKVQTPDVGRQAELSPKNRQALECFLECRAVGFPAEAQRDGAFRRNARIIDELLRQSQSRNQVQQIVHALALLKLGTA